MTSGTSHQHLRPGGREISHAQRDFLTRDDLATAGIAATDISASNGVIHVINSVLIPK